MRPVEVGNPHGRIALYLDKQEAEDLAALYGSQDRAHDELLDAVKRAYPEPVEEPESTDLAGLSTPNEEGR